MGASLGSDIPFFLHIASNTAAWVSGRGELVHTFPLPPPVQDLFFLLINPGFPVNTADAYQLLDEYRKTPPYIQKLSNTRLSTPDCMRRVHQEGNHRRIYGSVEETQELATRGSFRAKSLGMYPETKRTKGTTLPKQHTSSLQGEVVDFLYQILSGLPTDWPFSNDFLPVYEANSVSSSSSSEYFAIYKKILSDLHELGADFVGLSGSGSTCFGVFSVQAKAKAARKLFMKQQYLIIETFPLARRTIQYYNS
jgi:4-diphosphocytidyl-2C-methyl-D-erythritol kinase